MTRLTTTTRSGQTWKNYSRRLATSCIKSELFKPTSQSKQLSYLAFVRAFSQASLFFVSFVDCLLCAVPIWLILSFCSTCVPNKEPSHNTYSLLVFRLSRYLSFTRHSSALKVDETLNCHLCTKTLVFLSLIKALFYYLLVFEKKYSQLP